MSSPVSPSSSLEHPPLQSHPHKANATFTRRKHSKRLTGTNRAVGGLTRYHVNTANSRRDLLIPKNCLSFVARRILDIWKAASPRLTAPTEAFESAGQHKEGKTKAASTLT